MIIRVIGGHGGVSPGMRATSYLLDGKILIDAGSVAEGISLEEQLQIESIFISHAHLDHTKDLAFLADNCFGLKKSPFEVYTGDQVKSSIKNHIMNDEIWPDFTKLPNRKKPTIRFHSLNPEEAITLGEYTITPVPVNHPGPAMGLIVEHEGVSVVFTQDTGPTDLIWELAHKLPTLKAIFTEASFPNMMQHIATASQHHTPQSLKQEILKMPPNVPLFIGHLKPSYRAVLLDEITALNEPRITILDPDNKSYLIAAP